MLNDEGYGDIDDDITNVLDRHVMGQWTLEEWAWHLVEEEVVGQETIEQYFSYEDFGHDIRVSGDIDLILEDEYDVDSPEYEEAYNEICRPRRRLCRRMGIDGRRPCDNAWRQTCKLHGHEGVSACKSVLRVHPTRSEQQPRVVVGKRINLFN